MGAMGGISLAFIQIEPKEIADNPFKLIGSDWMPVSYTHLDVYKRQVE